MEDELVEHSAAGILMDMATLLQDKRQKEKVKSGKTEPATSNKYPATNQLSSYLIIQLSSYPII